MRRYDRIAFVASSRRIEGNAQSEKAFRPACSGRAVDPRRIDLHAHTNVSDGTLTPTQLVALAAQRGLAALAVTDHDHVGGIEEAQAAGARLGVEVVPGIELSVTHPVGEVHLLGYLLDTREPRLLAALQRFRDVREKRGALIVEKLQRLGVDIALMDLPPAGSVGRPHVARALVEKRIVKSVQEAFDLWLGEGKPAYVEKARVEAREALALVHGAGGVAVLAHPGLLSDKVRYTLVRELAALGLDGVEVEYSRHTSDERRKLRALADELGLVATGGSDFHGANKPDVELGTGVGRNVAVGYDVLDALRTRRGARGSPTPQGS